MTMSICVAGRDVPGQIETTPEECHSNTQGYQQQHQGTTPTTFTLPLGVCGDIEVDVCGGIKVGGLC